MRHSHTHAHNPPHAHDRAAIAVIRAAITMSKHQMCDFQVRRVTPVRAIVAAGPDASAPALPVARPPRRAPGRFTAVTDAKQRPGFPTPYNRIALTALSDR